MNKKNITNTNSLAGIVSSFSSARNIRIYDLSDMQDDELRCESPMVRRLVMRLRNKKNDGY